MNYQERIEKAKRDLERTKHPKLKMVFTVKTVKDERVCNECKTHEDYTDDVYKAVIGENHPPFHDGCRCYATYEMKGVRK